MGTCWTPFRIILLDAHVSTVRAPSFWSNLVTDRIHYGPRNRLYFSDVLTIFSHRPFFFFPIKSKRKHGQQRWCHLPAARICCHYLRFIILFSNFLVQIRVLFTTFPDFCTFVWNPFQPVRPTCPNYVFFSHSIRPGDPDENLRFGSHGMHQHWYFCSFDSPKIRDLMTENVKNRVSLYSLLNRSPQRNYFVLKALDLLFFICLCALHIIY